VHHQPAVLYRHLHACAVLGRRALSLNKDGSLIFSIWMRPYTGSTALAISRILRAAFSGSAWGG